MSTEIFVAIYLALYVQENFIIGRALSPLAIAAEGTNETIQRLPEKISTIANV